MDLPAHNSAAETLPACRSGACLIRAADIFRQTLPFKYLVAQVVVLHSNHASWLAELPH
jgi:hypothetical protein